MPYLGKQPANVPVTADDIPNDSITSAKILDNVITISDIGPNAVGNSEMADDAVGLNELSATGTTNSSTFLRGDNTWATAGSTSASDLTSGTLPIARIADDAITADKLANSINSAIAANTSKTGITSSQASAITANTAKTGITSSQATAITAALPKAGGTMTGNIAHAGDFTIDAGGDITLDADGADIKLKDAGTLFGSLVNASGDFKIVTEVADKDLIFRGNDGGSFITAMSIDYSAGGNVGIGTTSPAELLHVSGASATIEISASGDGATLILNNLDGSVTGDWGIKNRNGNGILGFSRSDGSGSDLMSLTTTGNLTITGDLASDNFQVKATAPGSPSEGDVWFNSSSGTVSTIPTKSLAAYNGTSWKLLQNVFSATGGTITTSGGYTIHSFTSSGTFLPNQDGAVEYLVIGGGGGGSGISANTPAGGGGGAGGYRTATGLAVTAQSYTVTIGAGGAGNLNGANGGNSTFAGIIGYGGGKGASYSPGMHGGNNYAGANWGGSGGGGTLSRNPGQGGTYGNTGGVRNNQGGGGGGGSSETGRQGNTGAPGYGGRGGNGTASSITGSAVTRAGGGGGGGGYPDVNTSASRGTAGTGGAGRGGGATSGTTSGNEPGVDATANTGSGGGGGAGGTGSHTNVGGDGGSGIVIIRYLS